MEKPRWHFRFENFEGAFALLAEAVAGLERGTLSQLEREGTIQRFEYTFELAWKSLRDYLSDSGNALAVPSIINVIRAAFAINLIDDGDAWVEAMKARNQMSHEYNRSAFEKIVVDIRERYFPLLLAVKQKLEAERDAGN